MVINANVCNGAHLAACATLNPPEIHTGADPESVAPRPAHPDPVHRQRGRQRRLGDRRVALRRADHQRLPRTRVAVGAPDADAGGLAADPAVATAYVTNGANTVCDDRHAAPATPTGPRDAARRRRPSPSATNPAAVAVDPATHTVYVADAGAGTTGTVTVFDDRTCNATDQAGCATVATLQRARREPGRDRRQPAHRHDLRRDHHQQRRAEPRSRCSTAPPATPPPRRAAGRRPRTSRPARRRRRQLD